MEYMTASLIEKTLIEMCKTTSFRTIKVKDICSKANISKQTFYNHFKDKFDIVTQIYLKDIYNDRVSKESDSLTQLKIQFETLWSKRDFYQNVFDDKSQNSLFHFAKTHSEAFNKQLVSSEKELTIEQRFSLSYNSYGWVGCFDDWIHGRLKLTSDEFAEIVHKIVPNVVNGEWQ